MIHLFWAPCAKGRPMVILNGKQCQWIPNVRILLWLSQVVLDQGYEILQNWGVAARVNVMLHPMG
jgi:hypothetical protein